MSKSEKAARLFKVFSVGARVRIVQLLKGRVLCVGALAARLGMSSAAVSQHLRILRGVGLVEPEKRGNFVHYRLDGKKLAECRRTFDALLTRAEKTDKERVPCVRKKRPAVRSRRT